MIVHLFILISCYSRIVAFVKPKYFKVDVRACYATYFVAHVFKAPFTRDRINLGLVPDWVQIGLAFTRDLLEPVRLRPLTRYDMGPHEEKSKYGLGLVQVSCKWQDLSHYGSISLSMLCNRNVHAVAAFYSSLISA